MATSWTENAPYKLRKSSERLFFRKETVNMVVDDARLFVLRAMRPESANPQHKRLQNWTSKLESLETMPCWMSVNRGQVAYCGEVKQVKPLGASAVLEEGESDWKVVAIDVNDYLVSILSGIHDFKGSFPRFFRFAENLVSAVQGSGWEAGE
ncbi:hypothetical protein BJX64DRAFT_14096 [Aspergillus heterothallicus]